MSRIIPRKRFGQHFLKDTQVLDRMVGAFSPKNDEQILEIGPGTGVLTERLLQKVDHITVVELDRDLATLLTQKFDSNKLTVIQHDILSLDIKSLLREHGDKKRLRIIGNLPYNISTPLLFHLIDQVGSISDMMFMLQKEVSLRLAAKAGDNNYGRLSVMSNIELSCECLFDVSPDSFDPPPKVDSTVLKLLPDSVSDQIRDRYRFHEVVKQAFSQRRKTLKNSLQNLVTETQFIVADIDSSLRAEKLSVGEFISLANAK